MKRCHKPSKVTAPQGKGLGSEVLQMSEQDSDSEAMSQPEVATVTTAIKNKKRNKKKRAHKLRREALRKKARSWNTQKGLLCCCEYLETQNVLSYFF